MGGEGVHKRGNREERGKGGVGRMRGGRQGGREGTRRGKGGGEKFKREV